MLKSVLPQLIRIPGSQMPAVKNRVVTIGNFDGVHRGHQSLLSRVLFWSQYHQAVPTVATFYPLPAACLYPDKPFEQLMTFSEKWQQLGQYGIESVFGIRFNAILKQMSPEAFVKEILVDKLHTKHLVVGEDFRFGHAQQGDVALLNVLGKHWGFECEIIAVDVMSKISSSTIRQSLQQGNLARANQCLGRPFHISGRVIHGQKRGRLLGVPTANIALTKHRVQVRGTYIVDVDWQGKTYKGVANIGKRPTVDGSYAVLEVHLFDFAADIYGERLQVRFLKRLRDEKRFETLSDLKQQIEDDMRQGRRYFEMQ